MARARYQNIFETIDTVSGAFKPVPNPVLTIYEDGSTTVPIAQTIYAGDTGGTTLPNPLTGASDGSVEFYIDQGQRVNIRASGAGIGTVVTQHELVIPAGLIGRSNVFNDTSFGLTVQNTQALGKGISVLNPAGWSMFNTQRSAGGNDVVSINMQNGTVPDDMLLLVAKTSGASYLMANLSYTQTGNGFDSAGLRSAAFQMTGNSAIRAGEFRVYRDTAATVNWTWCLELNMTSLKASATFNDLVGIYLAAGSGVGGEQRGSRGLLITGPAGWTRPIDVKDVDTTTSIWYVDQNGKMVGGNISPRTDSTYTIGSSSSDAFVAAYVDFFVATINGSAGAPAHTFYGDTASGGYLIGTGALGWTTGGVVRMALSSAALQAEQPLLVKRSSTPSAATGYDYLYPKTDDIFYKFTSGGVEVAIFDAATAAIATANLATNAVTKTGSAVGSTSSPTNANTTYVDLNEMSVTLSSVAASSDILVNFSGIFSHGSASVATYIAASLDGAAEVGEIFVLAPATATYQFAMSLTVRFAAVSAASHTIKIRWKTASGTATAYATNRTMTAIACQR